MSNIVFKPRRGRVSTMNTDTKKDLVLKDGELFIELPDSGTSGSKIKIGDGSTTYENLPYALGDNTEILQLINETPTHFKHSEGVATLDDFLDLTCVNGYRYHSATAFLIKDTGGWGPLSTADKWYRGIIFPQNPYYADANFGVAANCIIFANNMRNVYSGYIGGIKDSEDEPVEASWTELSNKSDISELSTKISNLETSFQDGCDTIVSGCTTYGSTPTSNAPADIVNAIKTIYTNRYTAGVNATKVGTAVAANVLADKTFTNSSSVGIKGTMANKGAVSGSITTSGGTYTIPAGYHNGSGKVTGPTLASLVGTNVTLASNANLLTGNTAYGKNGTKYTGSMANNGALNWNPSSSTSKTISAGYYSGGTISTSNAYNAGYSAGSATSTVTIIKQSQYNYGDTVTWTATKDCYVLGGMSNGYNGTNQALTVRLYVNGSQVQYAYGENVSIGNYIWTTPYKVSAGASIQVHYTASAGKFANPHIWAIG